MVRRYIDLHMHTHLSDGVYSPAEVLEKVRASGITAFAITDHDTIDGYLAMRELVEPDDPEILTGVELSVRHENTDLHILAYLFDPENDRLNSALEDFRFRRNARAQQIVEKLNGLGFDLSFEAVERTAGEGAVGRPHIAQAMVEENLMSSYQAVFDRYIGNGKKAYVPKRNFTPEEALDTIHAAGGVAILAHPAIDETHRYLDMLVELGLDGIEVYHSAHTQAHTDRFRHLAERYRLLMTGGSDFHGREGRHGAIGSQRVPEALLEPLKRSARARKESV